MCEVHVHEQRNEKTDKIIFFFFVCIIYDGFKQSAEENKGYTLYFKVSLW